MKIFRLRISIIFSLMAMTTPAFPQQTWNGLRFGMTLAEAMTKIHLIKDLHNKDGWNAPSATIHGLMFLSLLFFEPKLEAVILTYNRPTAGNSEEGLDYVTGEDIAADLAAKYGAAVRQNGNCAPDTDDSSSCRVMFSKGGQTVSLFCLSFQRHLMIAKITYAPVGSTL